MKDVLEAELPPKANNTLGSSSAMQIGLVLVLCSGIVTFTWWASALQATVTSVQRDVASLRLSIQNLDKVAVLDAEVRELRQYGSENARQTEKALADLRKEFELHKATTASKGIQ